MADDIDKADKIFSQLEKDANAQLKKAENSVKKLKRAYLQAVGNDVVWAKLVQGMEEGTEMGQDIESFFDTMGLTIEQVAKSNAKTLMKELMNGRSGAKEEALEELGSRGLEDLLQIDDSEIVKAIKSVKI